MACALAFLPLLLILSLPGALMVYLAWNYLVLAAFPGLTPEATFFQAWVATIALTVIGSVFGGGSRS